MIIEVYFSKTMQMRAYKQHMSTTEDAFRI